MNCKVLVAQKSKEKRAYIQNTPKATWKEVWCAANTHIHDANYKLWERIIHEERFPTPAPEAHIRPINKPKTRKVIDYLRLKDAIIEKCGYFGKCDKRICGVCTASVCDFKRYVVGKT